ncbi:MAG: hypothetical protein QXD55_01350 [Candidatus Aenigmatarchaeota archaeon]
MKWQECLENKIVNKTLRNFELSKSLFRTALERIKFIESAKGSKRFVIEGYYESLIEVIHTILSINGFKSYNHECSIEFLSEFYSGDTEKSDINFLHRLRMLRNLIKYEGKDINKESKYWIEGSKKIFEKLSNIIEREIKP